MPTTKPEIESYLTRFERRLKRVMPGIVQGSTKPVPEFVDRQTREWKVKQSVGFDASADIKDAVLTVPFGQTKISRIIRVEELLHARHSTSPKTDGTARKIWATKARNKFLQGAEDLRIKTMAVRGEFHSDKKWLQGETHLAKIATRALLRNAPNTMAGISGACPYPFEDFAYIYLSTNAHYNNHQYFDAVVPNYTVMYEFTARETQMFLDFKYDLSETVYRCRRGVHYRRLNQHTPGKYNPWTLQVASAVEKVVRKYEAKAKEFSPYSSKIEPSKAKERIEPPKNPPQDGETEQEAIFREASGSMGVHLPPLHRRLLFSIKTRSAASVGPMLHRIENITIDAVAPPIFAIRAPRANRAPVVLLDASGSMGVNAPDVEELIRLAPGCIVYFYNGDESWRGNLVRVSANGRFCERASFDERVQDGGNTVDYLALKYCLDHHPGHPMHWVTDEGYTWPRAKRYTINAQLTEYAKKKGVIFHRHINVFGEYAKKNRMGKP